VPTAEQHEAQAAANREFYDAIGGADSEQPDWALTILFYAAVHEIGVLFANNRATIIGYRLKWPPETHSERKEVLRTHVPWNRLASHYGHFESWSRKTRYDCVRPDRERLLKMEAVLQLIKDEIARVG